jgi:predicted PurR-regulated permease PerM
MAEKINKIEISHRTIVFTVLFLLSLRFLYEIRSILLALFISIILMAALNPLVDKLEKIDVPRWVAILFLYVLILALLIGPIAALIPPLVEQTSKLVNALMGLADELTVLGLSSASLQAQLQELGGLPAQIVKLSLSVVSNIASIIGILIMTFYLLMERSRLEVFLLFLFGQNGKDRADSIVDKLEDRLGGWVRTQFLLMTIIGSMSYIGFRVLNINFALPLAITAGILEMLIYIGPIITAILAFLVGLLQSPLTGLMALGWSILIQQIENNILVPQIVKKTLGVNPLITIIALAVGFKIGGIAGAILSLPVYLTLEVLFKEFLLEKMNRKQGE